MNLHSSLKDREEVRRRKSHPGQKASQERKRLNQQNRASNLKEEAERKGVTAIELVAAKFSQTLVLIKENKKRLAWEAERERESRWRYSRW